MSDLHLKNLTRHTPDLRERKILDLGSGRGGVLLSATEAGYDIIGLEYSKPHITEALRRGKERGISLNVIQGRGEDMPFSDHSFGFINMAQVIEHVESPIEVMKEADRVLAPGGIIYVSVPSRFSMRDPHFHIYGVNLLPRSWSDAYISLFRKHKDYSDASAGAQRLSEMHYYRYGAIKRIFHEMGFSVQDIRAERIRKKFPLFSWITVPLFRLIQPLAFGSFHFLLKK